eukprot:Skav214238  [mRNA]  locus=scaffold1133:164970:169397:+ [translate_table: standard]
MLIFPGEMTHYAGMLAASRQLPLVQESVQRDRHLPFFAEEMMEIATETFDFDLQRVFEECTEADCASRTARPCQIHPIPSMEIDPQVADCAAYELFREQQPEAQRCTVSSSSTNPRAVAGFAVGEFAALVAAGVMSYDQVHLVDTTCSATCSEARAEAMQRWVDDDAMAAVAVFGLEEEQLKALCADPEFVTLSALCSAPQVFISHCWGRKGFVCSGTTPAVEQLEGLVETQSLVTTLGKYHRICRAGYTPLATAVAAEAKGIICCIQLWCLPQVYFNCGFRVAAGEALLLGPTCTFQARERTKQILKKLLFFQGWDITINSSLQRGIRRFYECGPGHSLKACAAACYNRKL